jgi:flagellar basal-body rod protein FlgB
LRGGKGDIVIKDLLSDPASVALAKCLEGAAARQHALASNIANIETPGYTRQDVSFHASLRAALRSSGRSDERAQRLRAIRPTRFRDTSQPRRADGNNVDIDHEMSELARNSLEFQAGATALSIKARMLRTAITEGRR